MPLLSIVIPVFNSEKYLSECLSSLFIQEQSGKIEVICVDDGSTDQSLKIIKEYSTRQVNLRWIAQENRGVSSARNEGMKIARGDYITFVDSDDWIEPMMYEKLYQKAKEENADLVVSDFLM